MISTWERFIEQSQCLNAAKQANDEKIDYFVNSYFCKHYIGTPFSNGKRGTPRFSIDLWNVHQSTIQGTNKICIDTHNIIFLTLIFVFQVNHGQTMFVKVGIMLIRQ